MSEKRGREKSKRWGTEEESERVSDGDIDREEGECVQKT